MLSDYDRLEECFRLPVELVGEPVPDHRTMLERAGLVTRAAPKPEPELLPMGRWEVGDAALVVPAGDAVKATLDRQRGLVLEIEGELPGASRSRSAPTASYCARRVRPGGVPVARSRLPACACACGEWHTLRVARVC